MAGDTVPASLQEGNHDQDRARGCLALAIALGSAGQASADQYDFISELDSAGVSYPSTSEMIGIGKAVCRDLRLGLPVETALSKLQNSGFAPYEAAVVVAAASLAMCTDQRSVGAGVRERAFRRQDRLAARRASPDSGRDRPGDPKVRRMNLLDRFFEISVRGSTVGAEVRGGLVTFIAMAYIVVLNPIILSSAPDVFGHKLNFAQVSATTSLAAGVMTILFGVFARLPFAFAAGLGINSFLATTVVGTLSWPEAMGLVVINGAIIMLLAVTGLRRLVFDAVPMQLKLAITAGIGLFILFIGLVDAGFISSTGLPSPPVGLGTGGNGSITTIPTLVFVGTLL